MNRELDQEMAELKTFIVELKADRAAQKEKEQRENWTKYTAISLVFIAVLAAIATQWSGKYSSRVLVELNNSTFHQAKASDQWAYYQSKSIKQNLYEVVRETGPKSTDPAAEERAAKAFEAKVEKYKTDEAKIMADAKALEGQVENARQAARRAGEHGSGMGTTIAIFQIAIALGSICLVTKRRGLWYLSLILAALATVQMILVWCS
jgi:hypothetical protein